MEIPKETIIKLIQTIEPIGFAKAELAMNGYGKAIKQGNKDKDFGWEWDKDKLRSMDESSLNNIIKELVWNG